MGTSVLHPQAIELCQQLYKLGRRPQAPYEIIAPGNTLQFGKTTSREPSYTMPRILTFCEIMLFEASKSVDNLLWSNRKRIQESIGETRLVMN